MTILTSSEGITANQLGGGFFEGWPNPPSPKDHLRILRGSSFVVLAMDGDRVIGFVTAISDGVSSAYIPHLEVLPSYRRQGIGSALMRRMVDQLRHLYMVDLSCDDDVAIFYTKLGFQKGTSMLLRNYDRQLCD